MLNTAESPFSTVHKTIQTDHPHCGPRLRADAKERSSANRRQRALGRNIPPRHSRRLHIKATRSIRRCRISTSRSRRALSLQYWSRSVSVLVWINASLWQRLNPDLSGGDRHHARLHKSPPLLAFQLQEQVLAACWATNDPRRRTHAVPNMSDSSALSWHNLAVGSTVAGKLPSDSPDIPSIAKSEVSGGYIYPTALLRKPSKE